jgi:geranylgeranyl diphosphate synthase type II
VFFLEPQSIASLKNLGVHFEETLTREIEALPIDGTLKEAVRYALLSGGKRIRPLFALALASDLNGSPSEQVLTLMVPLEMVHAASLVHDDLPALDNDDVRRGKPSLHRAFNESAAILCGDYLIPAAFSICCFATNDQNCTARLTRALSQAYGAVCYGQQLDLAPDLNAEALITVHRNKTAALFACAAEFAGIVTKQSEAVIQALHACGETLGMYFQFVDDFLDRDDDRPNLARGLSLQQALDALDAAFIRVEQSFVALEALHQNCSLKLTREIVNSVRAQLAS